MPIQRNVKCESAILWAFKQEKALEFRANLHLYHHSISLLKKRKDDIHTQIKI